MAITQISQITNRTGLQIDLPQLAGGELGWSVDERRLWIGNGTLAEGAPVIGNTEILTEFSDVIILPGTYTYQGAAAGYIAQTGPTPDAPVKQSLQSWMDQWASVKDFGAVGDGVTDDTAAINRALQQLYCIATNPQIRRSLFFPAGVYLVSDSILIPPYATLYGEGINGSIIQLDSTSSAPYVARTADSNQQTGLSIGNSGAITPQSVTISNMSFATLSPTKNIFLVEDANTCTFTNVSFLGPLEQADLTTNVNDTAGVRFASTFTYVTTGIEFNNCLFSGTTYGMNTATSLTGIDEQVTGITVTDSEFTLLYQAVLSGTQPVVNGGSTGIRITSSVFNSIYAEGIFFGQVSLNFTGHNIFYDVGNFFQGYTSPYTSIINFQSDNNVSVGDMFARTDAYSGPINPGYSFPRILINNTTSIAVTNGSQIALGTYVRQSGQVGTLNDGVNVPTTIQNANQVPLNISNLLANSFVMNYTISRNGAVRTGSMTVSLGSGSFPVTWSDDYTENTDTGITLTVVQIGNIASVQYTSTTEVQIATISYSLTTFT